MESKVQRAVDAAMARIRDDFELCQEVELLEDFALIEARHAWLRSELTAANDEVRRLREEKENWRRMYRELYCEIWFATEEEFDEVSVTDGLAHTDTVKELNKMLWRTDHAE